MTTNRFVMVSEWMVKGNVREFLRAEANADRLGLVRSRSRSLSLTITRLWQLRGISKGLVYMHDQGIIHGNLRGVRIRTHHHSCTPTQLPKTNVLIDNNGHACLADFGLIRITSDEPTITSSIRATTAQWMSPELLDPDSFGLKDSRPTEASDCYALGVVIYEVLSGQTPFIQYSNHAVVWRILDGERPKRPEGEQGSQTTCGRYRSVVGNPSRATG